MGKSKEKAPFIEGKVQAGFPSPADDYLQKPLDLNEYLVKNPPATFFVRAQGDSMIEAGIFEDDLLIVDRSLDPKSGAIIIASLDGEFTLKRFIKDKNRILLKPENPKYPVVRITSDSEFFVWGVVTHNIHALG